MKQEWQESDQGTFRKIKNKVQKKTFNLISRSLFKMLTVMIDAEKTERVTMTALFKFCDTQTNLRVIIRRGVCQVHTA